MRIAIPIMGMLVIGMLVLTSPVVAEETTFLPVIRQYGLCGSETEIPEIECEALRALYKCARELDWVADNEPCAWTGTSCEDGHVTSVFLAGSYIREGCRIPPEVDNLAW